MTPDEHNPTPPAAAPTPALPDDIKALLADTPKVTPEMRARLEQAAKDAAAPTPALPPEVREAIARILHCWEALPHPGVGTKQLCAALAPLWPRPVPVAADARELAERIHKAVFAGESHPDAETDAIAAVLAPVLAAKDAEIEMHKRSNDIMRGVADQLRAAIDAARREGGAK